MWRFLRYTGMGGICSFIFGTLQGCTPGEWLLGLLALLFAMGGTAGGPPTDISISNQTATVVLNLNDTAAFTLKVTNHGPNRANDVTVVDVFANASIVSANASAGSCSGTTTLLCKLGPLEVGQAVTIQLSVKAQAPGTLLVDDTPASAGCTATTLSGMAEVKAKNADKNPANNTATASSTIVASYTTISAALAAASNGSTIGICPGTYYETINLEGIHNVTLHGDSRDTVTVYPSTTLSWNACGQTTGRKAVVRVVNSTDIAVENITFDFNAVKANNVYGVLYCDSTGTLESNAFRNLSVSDAAGGYYEIANNFRAPGYSAGARAQISVKNNIYTDVGRVAVLTHFYTHAVIEGNTFSKTTDDFGYAIEIGGPSTAVITGNTISGYDTAALSDGSNSAGIYVENAFTGSCCGGSPHINKTVTIQGNNIYGNEYGLWIGNEYDTFAGDVDILATVKDNRIQNNLQAGIYVADEDRSAGSSVTLTSSRNDVTNNGASGYYFSTYGDGEIHASLDKDTITGHTVGVLVEDNASGASSSLYDIKVRSSNLNGNTTGINNTVATTVDAESNWWGCAAGPGSAGCAATLGNVDFTPWAAAPIP